MGIAYFPCSFHKKQLTKCTNILEFVNNHQLSLVEFRYGVWFTSTLNPVKVVAAKKWGHKWWKSVGWNLKGRVVAAN